MDIADLSQRAAALPRSNPAASRISSGGRGRSALFVHGVPLNGYHWRHIIERVKHRRRCIAIDLMGLGFTEIAPAQDVSFTAQAQMIAEVLDALGIDTVDLVANDSVGRSRRSLPRIIRTG